MSKVKPRSTQGSGTASGCAWIGLLIFLLLTATADADEPVNAVAVVEGLQERLVSVMKDAEALGFQGRYEKLAPEVTATHDLPSIARIVVGRYWRRLSEEQQSQYLETFRDLSIATYAHEFDGYNGEIFEFVSAERLGEDDAIVRTVLEKADGKQIRFDYQMRRQNKQWKILNIIVDGVSDLALKRSEYTGILKREGFDSLIDKLREKIALYSQTAKGG